MSFFNKWHACERDNEHTDYMKEEKFLSDY
jgi:hypothetical protein